MLVQARVDHAPDRVLRTIRAVVVVPTEHARNEAAIRKRNVRSNKISHLQRAEPIDLGSLEAAVKYLILGALSTGFLVYGIAWIYGTTGTTNLAEIATNAFSAYCDDVRSGRFPDDDHSYKMKPEEIDAPPVVE